MAEFNIPQTRKEVSDRINSDVKAQLPNSNPFLTVSFFGSLIYAFALRIYDVYQKILIMINQFFINTASGVYLERWGSIYGITRNPSKSGSGFITLTGTSSSTIPNGTALQSATGITYATQAQATIASDSVAIDSMSRTGSIVTVNFTSSNSLATGTVIDSITGATPTDFNESNIAIIVISETQFQFTSAGTQGSAAGSPVANWQIASVEILASSTGNDTNANSGSQFTITSPIIGVDNVGYAQFDGISGGTDTEDDDSYRERVLFRIQQPVSFFNKNAIITEVKKVAGVTRVEVFSPDDTVSSINISALTRDAQIATAASTNHGLVNGSYITVTGANEIEYNVIQQRVIIVDADTFAYTVTGSPTTPATGTILASYSYVEEGQVRIGFLRDNDDSQIPNAAEVSTVKTELLDIKPAHVAEDDLIVFAPIPVNVNFTFSSLSPNTTAMRSAISSGLDEYFRSATKISQDIRLANLQGAINNVIDESGSSPTYSLSSPSADIPIDLNEIGVLGTIIYPS